MLMTSILLQKRERPSEAAPVFISRIHPEAIPRLSRRKDEGMAKEKLGKWKGKTDAIAGR